MTVTRREWLGNLGLASASSLLWAYGCGGPSRRAARPDAAERTDAVRGWLRDAVARLATVYPEVHALAVTRTQATAAIDVIGAGVARATREGVVLVVHDRAGRVRERVTSELDAAGIQAAVDALIGSSTRRASLDLPPPPPRPSAPPPLLDAALRMRAGAIAAGEQLSSRIVYAATLIDIDDATVWSVGRAHDREQRLVRVRKRAIRAAWNGTRPVVAEAELGWRGGVDDHELDVAAAQVATRGALALMTPGAFADGERAVLLAPDVAAALLDAGARGLLTAAAARRPEMVARFANAAGVATSPLLTLVDDPGDRTAYGGFEFDDEGTPATPLTLLEGGRLVGALADRGAGRGRRPGHLGAVEAAPSHVRVAPGPTAPGELLEEGLALEGAQGVVLSPTSDRVVIGAARAREYSRGKWTGRIYADVEIVGNLSALMAAVAGVAAQPVVVPVRDEVDGEPRWRSLSTPALLTRGFVRAKRRRA